MSEIFIFQSSRNTNSYLTVKERKWPSYPVKQLLLKGLIRGRILDFGCGLGTDVAFLLRKGFDVVGYDPHYFPLTPTGQFDTILCSYVLNVLLPEEQVHVLMSVAELLKPTGKAYFSVRRDIHRSGFRTNPKLGVEVYQCNITLPFMSVLKVDHCEIYEYQHFNQLKITSKNDCPFCTPASDRELVTESAMVYAIFDKYPVAKGHTLIIPKQHVTNYFDLSDRAKTACWMVVDRVKILLTQNFQPDGFNLGINIGSAAGQTVPHVHIHLIPRYTGDVNNPTGGIRNVIPGRGDYITKNRER
jgi:ATP adenylyltransferase